MHKHTVKRAVVYLAGEKVTRAVVSCSWSGKTFTVSGRRCPSCGAKLRIPRGD